MRFESFVNSERCKTGATGFALSTCLRALLIRKDVKQTNTPIIEFYGLRALLIRKDVKPYALSNATVVQFESFVNSERCKTIGVMTTQDMSLRALLIRKDVKLNGKVKCSCNV